MAKKYNEWTAEEKEADRIKKNVYNAARKQALQDGFKRLREELTIRGVLEGEVLELFELCERGGAQGGNGGGGGNNTYMMQIFNTNEPAIGRAVSEHYVGVRGPAGERVEEGETLPQFVMRVGGITVVKDAVSIKDAIWHLKRRGHLITFENGVIVYDGYDETLNVEADK